MRGLPLRVLAPKSSGYVFSKILGHLAKCLDITASPAWETVSSESPAQIEWQPAAQKLIINGACCPTEPPLPPMCTYANHLKCFKHSTNSFGCQPSVTGLHQYNRTVSPQTGPLEKVYIWWGLNLSLSIFNHVLYTQLTAVFIGRGLSSFNLIPPNQKAIFFPSYFLTIYLRGNVKFYIGRQNKLGFTKELF